MSKDFKYIDDRVTALVENSNMIKSIYGDIPNEGNKHYVLWSGGTDSTLLLYELLDLYGSDNVIAISLKYPWLDETKWKTEMLHREAIKSRLALRGKRFAGFTHSEITISIENINKHLYLSHRGVFGYPQAVSWISIISVFMDDHSYLYTGGIRDDDLIIRRDPYHDLFISIAKTLDKEITLREPYLYLTKADILYKLFEYNLYDDIWYCELPKNVNEQCCLCTPCKTHMNALTKLTNQHLIVRTIPELIKLKAQEALDRIKDSDNFKNAYLSGQTVDAKEYELSRITHSDDKAPDDIESNN